MGKQRGDMVLHEEDSDYACDCCGLYVRTVELNQPGGESAWWICKPCLKRARKLFRVPVPGGESGKEGEI